MAWLFATDQWHAFIASSIKFLVPFSVIEKPVNLRIQVSRETGIYDRVSRLPMNALSARGLNIFRESLESRSKWKHEPTWQIRWYSWEEFSIVSPIWFRMGVTAEFYIPVVGVARYFLSRDFHPAKSRYAFPTVTCLKLFEKPPNARLRLTGNFQHGWINVHKANGRRKERAKVWLVHTVAATVS